METVKIVQIAVAPLSEFGAEALYGVSDQGVVYYFNAALQVWTALPMVKQ